MVSNTYDVFDDLSIHAVAHYDKFRPSLHAIATAHLPPPAECVMRKTFEELVEYSLNIPQIADLFTTATTWGGQDYTSGHGWAMRDLFRREEEFNARERARHRVGNWNSNFTFPRPHVVKHRELEREGADARLLNDWWYFHSRHTIEKTKGFRDACMTKAGRVVPARLARFREMISGAENTFRGEYRWDNGNYPRKHFATFYQVGMSECRMPDMTDRNGDKITIRATHYGDGGLTHYVMEQDDVLIPRHLREYHGRNARDSIFHLTIYDKLVRSNYDRARAYAYALATKNAEKKFPAKHHRIHGQNSRLSL